MVPPFGRTTTRGRRPARDGWAINGDTHITAVVVHKGKVAKSFAYVSVNEKDVREVMAELKKAVDKK